MATLEKWNDLSKEVHLITSLMALLLVLHLACQGMNLPDLLFVLLYPLCLFYILLWATTCRFNCKLP